MKKAKTKPPLSQICSSPEEYLLFPLFSCLRHYKKYGSKPIPKISIYKISDNEEEFAWVLSCFDIKTVGITKENILKLIDDSWLSTDVLLGIKLFFPEIIIDLDISKIHRGCICFEQVKEAINDPTNFITLAKEVGYDL